MATKIVKAVKKAVKKVTKKTAVKKVVKPTLVTCSLCNGRGLKDEYHICAECHGNGTV